MSLKKMYGPLKEAQNINYLRVDFFLRRRNSSIRTVQPIKLVKRFTGSPPYVIPIFLKMLIICSNQDKYLNSNTFNMCLNNNNFKQKEMPMDHLIFLVNSD